MKNILLPDDTLRYVKRYMVSNLWGSPTIIPIWNQSPIAEVKFPHLRYNGLVGDVGRFHSDGHFEAHFNIFLDIEENRKRKCSTPPNFEPFPCSSLEKFLMFSQSMGTARMEGFTLRNSEPDDQSAGLVLFLEMI